MSAINFFFSLFFCREDGVFNVCYVFNKCFKLHSGDLIFLFFLAFKKYIERNRKKMKKKTHTWNGKLTILLKTIRCDK